MLNFININGKISEKSQIKPKLNERSEAKFAG